MNDNVKSQAKTQTSPVHESLQESLEQGNINFDFLNPDAPVTAENEAAGEERRSTQRQGKRGLFNRGRPIKPVTRLQIAGWITILLISAFSLVAVLFSTSVLWLLILPVVIAVFIWSLMMVPLVLSKPH